MTDTNPLVCYWCFIYRHEKCRGHLVNSPKTKCNCKNKVHNK